VSPNGRSQRVPAAVVESGFVVSTDDARMRAAPISPAPGDSGGRRWIMLRYA